MKKVKVIFALIIGMIASGIDAEPLRYNLTGEIFLYDRVANEYSDIEIFAGSMVLSDSNFVDYYSSDPNDSRGEYVNYMTLSDFAISSSSYSLTQAGSDLFWVAFVDGSPWSLNTSLSMHVVDENGLTRYGETESVSWYGDMDIQPLWLEFPMMSFNSNDSLVTYRLANIVASPVPLPATVWLFISGLLGLFHFIGKK
jgi:hypothetical protein